MPSPSLGLSILDVFCIGLLIPYLQRKEEKRAEKRAKADAEAERLQKDDECAEHRAEIERKYQAAQEALRAEELRRQDAAQQAKEQAEDLKFSNDPLAYIETHFYLLNKIMQEGEHIITFVFGNGGNINQRLTESVLIDEPEFGASWESKAVSSRALCVKMDKYLEERILTNDEAWVQYW